MKSNSRKTENNAQSPVMFEPLEPRVLLSAALPVAPMD
ncbi:MAG: LEPR-XLL domain-containing protein, partial [Planctomycetota bacterium]